MSSAVLTAAGVPSGGTWYTPKPSCGMVLPSFSSMFGTLLTGTACPVGLGRKRSACPSRSTTVELSGQHERLGQHRDAVALDVVVGLAHGLAVRRQPRHAQHRCH